MTPFFNELFEEVLMKEGGYSNHPYDPGGKTKYGITEAVAREFGYKGPMQDLTLDLAKTIYYRNYFVRPGFERVSEISKPIARELFDTGVNTGVRRASEFLQQSLNVLNRMQKDYRDIKEDGDVGGLTREALTYFLKKRGKQGELVLLRMLEILQGYHYFKLSVNRNTNEEFMYGWISNRISLVPS
jgi:lysozyme family protein